MPKLILEDVSNLLGNPTSAANTINKNSNQIEAALENTLSRNGTTPNQMGADFDMNHYDVLNVGTIHVEDLIIGGGDSGLIELIEQAVEDSEAAADRAEVAAEEAENWAEFAKNNWSVLGPFTGTGVETYYPLSIDPGSVNNMFINVSGITQLIGEYSLEYILDVPQLVINVPLGVTFEVRTSNAVEVEVGTPTDGTVTTPKIVNGAVTADKLDDDSVTTVKILDDNVTFDKLQDISTTRLLGRKTASTGNVEQLTADDLIDFLPTGSVIQRRTATYTTNADLTASIPTDDTIPQNTEGTIIATIADFIPRRANSILKMRFFGQGTRGDAGAIGAFICSAVTANSFGASYGTVNSANYNIPLIVDATVTPGSTSAVTYRVHVGPLGSGTMRMNGSASGHVFGAAMHAIFEIEEIKQ